MSSYIYSNKNGVIRIGSVATINANDNIKLPVTFVYPYTGSVQTVTVPTGYNTAFIECWGAGGGTQGKGQNTGNYNSGYGGGGGYTSATLSIPGVTSLNLIVGQAGQTATSGASLSATFGGGGGQTNGDANWPAASGGGRSAVQLLGNDIITAGGGGAGGSTSTTTSSYYIPGNYGGGGGGTTGGDAYSYVAEGGKGGTSSAGGVGGTAGSGGITGAQGSQYQGGNSGGPARGPGGGGGYYGGGSGGCFANGFYYFGGGGGGSSFVSSARVLGGTTPVYMQSSNGIVANAAGLPSGYSQSTVGNGGPITYGSSASPVSALGSTGQNGLIVITYTAV